MVAPPYMCFRSLPWGTLVKALRKLHNINYIKYKSRIECLYYGLLVLLRKFFFWSASEFLCEINLKNFNTFSWPDKKLWNTTVLFLFLFWNHNRQCSGNLHWQYWGDYVGSNPGGDRLQGKCPTHCITASDPHSVFFWLEEKYLLCLLVSPQCCFVRSTDTGVKKQL